MYREDSIYYPPEEMHSFFLPVSRGCSYNGCSFCAMYKDNSYSQVDLDSIRLELMNGSGYEERVFLTGADPLSIGYDKMVRILFLIREYLPYCKSVAAYASVSNIRSYSLEELASLHRKGLNLLYIGFESGWDQVLNYMNKDHSLEEAIEEGRKLNKAGIAFNTIIMLGLAGKGRGKENGLRTAQMINSFSSRKIISMNLKVFHGTRLSQLVAEGDYKTADQEERLEELRVLLENIRPRKDLVFDTSHTTNFIKIKGVLPRERQRLVGLLDK